MLETLKQWDQSLLLNINLNWTNSFFDWLFPAITDLHHTIAFKFIFVPALFLFLLYKKKVWGISFFLFLILSVATSDLIGGQVIKPTFQRLRPPVAGLQVQLRSTHYGGYSFPSNHSANMFSAATFVSIIAPPLGFVMYPVAALVAYSRVYCGVHYPGDVLFGALLGIIVGNLYAVLFRKFFAKVKNG
jgi:undecaprenyl-diphosphatase